MKHVQIVSGFDVYYMCKYAYVNTHVCVVVSHILLFKSWPHVCVMSFVGFVFMSMLCCLKHVMTIISSYGKKLFLLEFPKFN